MAKKPDTPCSGCGKLLWGGNTSLPAGQRMCRECRHAATNRTCRNCGQHFKAGATRTVYCSIPCSNRDRSNPERYQPRPCAACGTEVRNTGTLPLCTACAPDRRAERYRSKCRRRRTLKLGGIGERYTLAEIAERDRYRCGLCRRRVDMTKRVPDLMAPVIDHMVPLSLGGDDTRANVWLAHYTCNSTKGARAVGEQLALI